MKTDRRLGITLIGLCVLVSYVQAQVDPPPPNTNVGANLIRTQSVASGGQGTAPDTPCYFPFFYNGETYTQCTFLQPPDDDVPSFICGTTYNLQADERWGECPDDLCNARTNIPTTGGVNSGDLNCCSAWIFSLETYTGCTTAIPTPEATPRSVPWCAVYNSYDSSLVWGECDPGVVEPDPTTTEEPAAATTTPAPTTECPKYIFNTARPGYQIFGGEEEAGADTKDECAAVCNTRATADEDDCTYFAFDTTDNVDKCWINQRGDSPTIENAPDTYVSYKASLNPAYPNCDPDATTLPQTTIPGDCQDNFIETEDMNGSGGVRESGVTTSDACADACRAKAFDECGAYDFNSGDSSCWLFTTEPSSLNNANNINHYRREACVDGTGSTGPCSVSYESTDNKLSFNGELDDTAESSAECADVCTGNSACVGYDFDENRNECWIHDDLDNFETNTRTNANGVTQYKKIDTCGTGVTGTDITGTGEICTTRFEKKTNTNAVGGTRVSGVDTQEGCEEDCMDSSTCKSYDFSRTNDQCFTHTNDEQTLIDEGKLQTGTNGVDHYVKVITCTGGCLPSQDTFNKETDMNANGARRETSADTLDECRAYCLDQPRADCVGFDWNRANSQCWVHEDEANFDDKRSNDDVDLYIRVACGCSEDEFEKFEDTNANGATRDTSADTVDECKAACLEDSDCVAFDFNNDNNQCWIHTDADEVTESNRRSANNVDLYLRVPCTGVCPTGDAAFEKFDNTNANGAQRDSSIDTYEECRDECLDRGDDCAGFDYNRVQDECWIHDDADNIVESLRRTSSQIDLYVKKPCENCNRFETVDDTNALGGTKADSSIDSVSECRAECLSKAFSGCAGFDFNGNTDECWIHEDEDNVRESNRRSNSDVTLYIRICDAVGSVTPTGGTGGTDVTGTGPTPTGRGTCFEEDSKRYFGASEITSADIRAECEDDCFDETDCVAYGWDSDQERCWQHTSQSDLDGRSDTLNNYMTYIKGPCAGCIDTFEVIDNRNALGGTRVTDSNVDTAGECEDYCLDRSFANCAGFDFNDATDECFIHDDEDNLRVSNRRTNSDTTLYIREVCVCDDYELEEDTQYFGAESNSANSVANCKEACNDDSDCVGIGWNGNTDECWLHMAASQLSGDSGTLTNYDTYKKGSGCPGGTGTPTGTGCPEGYQVEEDTRYFGAEGNSATARADCEDACDDTSGCLGYGYDGRSSVTTKCWLHTDSSNFDSSDSLTNYDTYRLSTDCVTGTGTGLFCTITYEREQNRQYFGASQDENADTKDECEDICDDDSDCLGFGFDTNPNPDRCWIHTDTDDFDSSNSLTGYDTYIKSQDCATGSDGICVPTYSEHEGSYSIGGSRVNNVDTVNECKDWCTARSECGAFDFNSNDECFWHDNGDWQNNLNTGASGVTQYRKTGCDTTGTGTGTGTPDCRDTFASTQGRYGRGGERDPDADTKDECEQSCLDKSTSECVGFDFNTQDNSCWIHKDTDVFNNLQVDSSNVITNYERQPCTTTGECTFTKNTNVQSFGADLSPNNDGETACANHCRSLTDCVAFDIIKSTNDCYIHTDIADLDNTRTNTDSDHYIKDPNCHSTGTDETGTGTGSVLTTRCPDAFEVERDTLAFNGDRVTSANTESLCREDCAERSDCVAFDFDTTNNRCYRHTDPANNEPANKRAAEGVDHYEKIICGAPPEDCEDIFDIFERTHAYDGTYVSTSDSVELCADSCLANADCVAYDFNGGCYIHLDIANLEDVNTNVDNVNHYRRKPNPDCGTDQTSRTTPEGTGPPCVILNTYTAAQRDVAHVAYPNSMGQTAGGRTVSSCQTECNGMAECKAFMFYRLSASCVFFNTFGETRSLQGFDYYERQQDCGEEPVCPPVTRRIENQSSTGGTRVPLANSLAECLETCVDDNFCAGIDFVESATLNNRCFTHTTTTILNRRTNSNSVQYVIDQRGCPGVPTTPPTPVGPCVMQRQPNRMQNGGDPVMSGALPTTMTAEECRDLCGSDERCKGADYNIAFRVCFIHYVDGPITTQAGIDHYTKTQCPPGCFESFRWEEDQAPNVANQGVVVSVNPQGQSPCAERCFDNPLCDAFTYGIQTSVCRHYLNVGPLSNNQIIAVQNTDLYVRVRCEIQPPPTTPPPFTINPILCVKTGYQQFISETIFSQPGIQNSRGNPGVNSANDCLTLCTTTGDCLAMTFIPANPPNTFVPDCVFFTTREYAKFTPEDAPSGLISYIATCQEQI